MKIRRKVGMALMLGAVLTGPSLAQDAPEIDLKIGVLAGLSGELASAGQPWLEAARIGTENLIAQIEDMGMSDSLSVTFVGGEDSQGNAQSGIEAARKLTSIEGANVVVGDFYSSVTVTTSQSVFIPEEVLVFTGGTAPSISAMNRDQGKTWVWRMAPPDSVQGPTMAKLIGQELGTDATLSVAARNDTYGVGLLDAFKSAWIEGGGSIAADIIYNPDAPSMDSEGQRLAANDPDGWFIVAFCNDWSKLRGPLLRTENWDPNRTFGGDALNACPAPNVTIKGMRMIRGDVTNGASNEGWQTLYAEKADENIPYQSWTVEAFDAPYLAFLAAVKAGSSDTNAIRQELVSISSAPGVQCTFETLSVCVDALLAGKDIDFEGASGSIEFQEDGDQQNVVYTIHQSQGDGSMNEPIIGKISR